MKQKLLLVLLLLSVVLFTGCEWRKFEEPEIEYHLVQEGVYTFADGTRVDLWQDEWKDTNYYWLADGTPLVIERYGSGPENVHVIGQEDFDDLTAEAQEKVTAYYVKQGLLYDIGNELEKVYAGYLDMQMQGKEEEFSALYVEQNVSPASSNDRIMCFTITVRTPLVVQERISQTESCCTVFDRTTGEVLPLSELFTIPEAEICRTLLDRAQLNDAAVQAKMEKAFLPEYIIFYPGVLEIDYPHGVLEEYSNWIVAVDYEDIKDILQPWAIPYQEE